MKEKKVYKVYYRTGGRENFRWQYVLNDFDSKEKAYREMWELKRMGYPAHVALKSQILSIGLPETFDPGDRIPQS